MRRLIFLCLLAGPLAAAPRHFASGPGRTALLELYTSEGCSSCPPAENVVAELQAAPGLWRDFVPVVFHVAYWDRLGWRDRFASRQFTARQYAYAGQWQSERVYTPGFVLDGAEWRHGASLPPASAAPAGMLAVDYAADGTVRVRFPAAGDYEAHAALLGGGITSVVRAGENAGRTLHHEFVALQLADAPLANGTAVLTLPPADAPGVTRHALAVWVTRRGELVPRQATGGWLDQ